MMNFNRYFILIILLSNIFHVYSQKENKYSFYETDSKVINSICFTKNGEALGAADLNTIKVFSTNSRMLLNEFKDGHKDQILSINISIDSTLLVSGGKDSLIIIWDFINNRIIHKLNYQESIVTSVQISPSGKYLLSGGTNNKIFLYDISENKRINEITNHCDLITSVAFSPDEKYFASSSADKSVHIYETKSGNLLVKLSDHKNWVRSIAFNKDGNTLISCGDNSKIILWDISDKENIKLLTDSRHGFTWLLSADLNQDNKTYAFGDFKGNAKIIGQFGRYETNIKVPINKILFKPNEGNYLKIAVATRGKGVLLIDAKNMKLKH